MNAHAPTGAGFATRPVTVLAKMAKSVHARGVSASGTGHANRTARPTPTERAIMR